MSLQENSSQLLGESRTPPLIAFSSAAGLCWGPGKRSFGFLTASKPTRKQIGMQLQTALSFASRFPFSLETWHGRGRYSLFKTWKLQKKVWLACPGLFWFRVLQVCFREAGNAGFRMQTTGALTARCCGAWVTGQTMSHTRREMVANPASPFTRTTCMAYVAKPSCCGLDSRFMLAFPRKKQKDIVVRLPGHLVARRKFLLPPRSRIIAWMGNLKFDITQICSSLRHVQFASQFSQAVGAGEGRPAFPDTNGKGLFSTGSMNHEVLGATPQLPCWPGKCKLDLDVGQLQKWFKIGRRTSVYPLRVACFSELKRRPSGEK